MHRPEPWLFVGIVLCSMLVAGCASFSLPNTDPAQAEANAGSGLVCSSPVEGEVGRGCLLLKEPPLTPSEYRERTKLIQCPNTTTDGQPAVLFDGQANLVPSAVTGQSRLNTADVSIIHSHQLSLTDVLQTAAVENPIINLAREAVREAEAEQLAAEALKLPSIHTGMHFRLHTGNLQQTSGNMLDTQLQSLYFGAGAGAWGAGTVLIPGLRLYYPLADIIGEPQAAVQRVNTRQGEQIATENVTLQLVVEGYYHLARASAVLAALHQIQHEFDEVVRLTKSFAEAGQGRQADANRALAYAELQKQQLLQAEAEVTAASARLSKIINLDPTVQLNLTKDVLLELKLIDVKSNLTELLEQAESRRPEIVAGMSMLAEAEIRLRQEQLRPWLPTITAGLSYGRFSGSGNLSTSQPDNISGRTDFDVTACWTFQNLGLGNHATQHRLQAVVFQAVANLQDIRNRVRAEVTEAHAQLQAACSQLDLTRRQLASAEATYLAERKRIEHDEGLPLEVLDSVRSLSDARLAVIQAVTAFNIAQFKLLTSIGTAAGQLHSSLPPPTP